MVLWQKYRRLTLPLLATFGLWAFFIWYAVTTIPQLPDQIPEIIKNGYVTRWNSKYLAVGIFGSGTILLPVLMLLMVIFGLPTTPNGNYPQAEYFSTHLDDFRVYLTYLRGYLMWMGFAIGQLMTEIFVITLESAKLVDYTTGKAGSLPPYTGIAVGVLVLQLATFITIVISRANWMARGPRNNTVVASDVVPVKSESSPNNDDAAFVPKGAWQ